MIKIKTSLSALSLSLLVTGSAVLAQETRPPIEPVENEPLTFDDIDTDDDGALEEDELEHAFGPAAQAALAKFDTDGDGNVTLAEVRSTNNAGGNSEAREAAKARKAERSTGSKNNGNRGGGNRGDGEGGENRGGGNRGESEGGGNRGGGNGNGNGNGRN